MTFAPTPRFSKLTSALQFDSLLGSSTELHQLSPMSQTWYLLFDSLCCYFTLGRVTEVSTSYVCLYILHNSFIIAFYSFFYRARLVR